MWPSLKAMLSAYLFQDSRAYAKLFASIVDRQVKVFREVPHSCLAFWLPKPYFICLLQHSGVSETMVRGCLHGATQSLTGPRNNHFLPPGADVATRD